MNYYRRIAVGDAPAAKRAKSEPGQQAAPAAATPAQQQIDLAAAQASLAAPIQDIGVAPAPERAPAPEHPPSPFALARNPAAQGRISEPRRFAGTQAGHEVFQQGRPGSPIREFQILNEMLKIEVCAEQPNEEQIFQLLFPGSYGQDGLPSALPLDALRYQGDLTCPLEVLLKREKWEVATAMLGHVVDGDLVQMWGNMVLPALPVGPNNETVLHLVARHVRDTVPLLRMLGIIFPDQESDSQPSPQVMFQLLRYFASIDRFGSSPIQAAVGAGNEQAVRHLADTLVDFVFPELNGGLGRQILTQQINQEPLRTMIEDAGPGIQNAFQVALAIDE